MKNRSISGPFGAVVILGFTLLPVIACESHGTHQEAETTMLSQDVSVVDEAPEAVDTFEPAVDVVSPAVESDVVDVLEDIELPEEDVAPEPELCGVFAQACPEGFTCNKDDAGIWPGFCHSVTDAYGDEVWVPAGTLYMGCNTVEDPSCWLTEKREEDSFLVTTPEFAIDRLEVTVAEYRECVASGVCSDVIDDGFECPGNAKLNVEGAENLPINCLRRSQAATFCAYRGKVLPSESMWERAIRGGCDTIEGDCKAGMRVYPWGNKEPSCEQAIGDICGVDIQPVDALPMSTGPYGVQQGAGNACEWVADNMDPTMQNVPEDGSPNKVEHPEYGTIGISKGGSFRGWAFHLRSSFRHAPYIKMNLEVFDFVGVRCARILE